MYKLYWSSAIIVSPRPKHFFGFIQTIDHRVPEADSFSMVQYLFSPLVHFIFYTLFVHFFFSITYYTCYVRESTQYLILILRTWTCLSCFTNCLYQKYVCFIYKLFMSTQFLYFPSYYLHMPSHNFFSSFPRKIDNQQIH